MYMYVNKKPLEAQTEALGLESSVTEKHLSVMWLGLCIVYYMTIDIHDMMSTLHCLQYYF